MRYLIAILILTAGALSARDLEIHFVDVEGGQATLIITPGGESLLVDAGFPRPAGRDSARIAAAAKKAGLSSIDYLVVTHYHSDHVGGVEPLLELIPVRTFVDHGDNVETGRGADALNASYAKALATGKRLMVKPGDRIPLKGVEIRVVAAHGNKVAAPLKGGGGANSLCASATKKEEDPTENARSTGFVLDYGNFRFVDLGDLTWNKEIDLVCPSNPIGRVDLYLTTHHGSNQSGPATIVHALAPRVAVMNNGARKGGSPDAWQIVRQSPGLEDLWQVHFAVAGGKENNSSEEFIANVEEKCEGHGLSVVVAKDGSFSVTNHRNGHSKKYSARKR
jgi:beta-lactamase superfamily II metal-dependent hydrolase